MKTELLILIIILISGCISLTGYGTIDTPNQPVLLPPDSEEERIFYKNLTEYRDGMEYECIFKVRGDSMIPLLKTDDLVLGKKIESLNDLEIGDTIPVKYQNLEVGEGTCTVEAFENNDLLNCFHGDLGLLLSTEIDGFKGVVHTIVEKKGNCVVTQGINNQDPDDICATLKEIQCKITMVTYSE